MHAYDYVLKACRDANLTGYVGDSYAVMRASLMTSEIPSVYVPIRANPPGEFKLQTIRERSKELGKTDVGKALLKVVEDELVEQELSDFFPQEQVRQVKEKMLTGLKEGLSKAQ